MRALVADDEATNRIVLKRLLTRWGYEVVVAEDGQKAWDILSAPDAPRLAVLDWQMPGIDGVDICRMLSLRVDSSYVYTVLVSQKTTMQEMASALDAGADDFIRKPVDPVELRSRLGVAQRMLAYEERLHHSNQLLKEYGHAMEQLAEERANQLMHADRMATLVVMSAGMAHEINNPATFIAGNAKTLERFAQDLLPHLDPDDPKFEGDIAHKIRFIKAEMPRAIAGIQQGVQRVTRIVKGLRDYARQEKGERKPCDVGVCMRQAVELCQFQLRNSAVQVIVEALPDLPQFLGDAQQIEQVLINLVVNASHAVESVASPQVRMRASHVGDNLEISVHDNGPGIPEEFMGRIWDPFFTSKPAGKGTGLGLPICRRIAEAHGGSLAAENSSEGGACFTLSLPCYAEGMAA